MYYYIQINEGRMDETCSTQEGNENGIPLIWKTKGTRPLGRLRYDDIKMDIKCIGFGECGMDSPHWS
jgi:hypothetical protein